MADNASISSLEAVDEYFDMLIKSRFIEMFGDLVVNPKHWTMKTIGDVAKVHLHYGSTASAVDYDSKIRYVRITDIGPDGKLNDDFKSPSVFDSTYLLNKGDILFARSGSVGVTCYYDEPYQSIFAGYLIRLIPDEKLINPEFAYQFTRSTYCQGILVGSKRGGVQKNVNAKQIAAIPIPLPPMELQNEFIDFVHRVDKSKAICKQIFQSLDDLVKSRFIEMFGNKNWKKDTLESLLLPGAGLPYGIVQPGDEYDGGTPIIRPVDIIGGTADICKLKHTDPQISEAYKRTILNGNEILVTVRATIGRTMITDERYKGMNVTRGVAVIRYNPEKINGHFLNEYLNSF